MISSELTTIYVPLVNVNEPEAQTLDVLVKVGQQVSKGDLLCVLETTKATTEVVAESNGYIHEIMIVPGQQVRAGDKLCIIGSTPPEEKNAEVGEIEIASLPQSQSVPDGLRLTKPAEKLAITLGVSLDLLPKGPIITEAVVRQYAESNRKGDIAYLLPEMQFDSRRLLIFGGGGHGKAVIDLARQTSLYELIGIVDDGIAVDQHIMGLAVLGSRAELSTIYEDGVRLAANAVGALTRIQTRIDIFALLAQHGFGFPVMLHPEAAVEPTASLSAGAQIFANAYIGSDASIGFGAIINTAAVVSHDCRIGNYCHIAPGAILAGEVSVGDGTLVGMGVTTGIGINIGAGAQIGNGARIHADLPDGVIIRSGTTWSG